MLAYIGVARAIPLVERWWHINKLIEPGAFIDSLRVKSAELKDKFLFYGFTGFCVSLVFLPTPWKLLTQSNHDFASMSKANVD